MGSVIRVIKQQDVRQISDGILARNHLRANKRYETLTHNVTYDVLSPQKMPILKNDIISDDFLKHHIISQPQNHKNIIEVRAPQKDISQDILANQDISPNKALDWSIDLPFLQLARGVQQKQSVKNIITILAIIMCHMALALALFLNPTPPLEPSVNEVSIEVVVEKPAPLVQTAQEQPLDLPLPDLTLPDIPLPDIPLIEPAPVVVDMPAAVPDVVESAPMTLDPSPIVVRKPVIAKVKQKPDLELVRREKRQEAKIQEAKNQEIRDALNKKRKLQEAKAQARSRNSERAQAKQVTSASSERASGADLADYGAKIRAILQGRVNSLGFSDVKGSVGVSFTVSGSGRMASLSLSGSTGDFKFDRAIRSTLASSALPPPPQGQFSGIVTIRIR